MDKVQCEACLDRCDPEETVEALDFNGDIVTICLVCFRAWEDDNG